LDYRASSRVVKFLDKFLREIAIEMYLSREGCARISPGIAVNAQEFTAPGHVNGAHIP
jgi:hypothetical protein